MCQLCSMSDEHMEPTENKFIGPNNEQRVVGSSMDNAVNQEQRTVNKDGSSPYEAPLTRPTISLTSIDSIASNCSDYSVDVNQHDGHNPEAGGSDSGQDDPRYTMPNGHLSMSNSSANALEDSRISIDSLDSNDDSSSSDEFTDEENEPSPAFDDKDGIWDPPEAENDDDDKENSVAALADDDDDDDCADGDGTEWAKPSSLNSFHEGVSSSYRFKEEKEKAMEEVMNGKFRNLVSELLKKLGFENCDKTEESWVDIVTQLAWQAASFVKPDMTEGKAMDPAGYVKIKCVASGSRSESQLVKGLVFKKHAAHKHMVTKYKNPRLLLIQGMLGQSSGSSGLSSFNAMISQDKDNIQSYYHPLIENLKVCHANVILVEKSASRDVLEEVLKLGVTLVLDMKLHRLERVARCTGSPILSSDITFSKKLKHCDSLYFEKFVEEHATVGEGGKKPCKTLMFLEGCPTRLGCTILLKGSQSEELKKIKCVVQCAVVMAYHFILETSFLVDQKAMFSTIAFGQTPDILLPNEQSTSIVSETSMSPHGEEPNVGGASVDGPQIPISTSSDEQSSHVFEVPISNGCLVEESTHVEKTSATSNGFHEPHVGIHSSASSSINDALAEVSLVSPVTYQHMSTYMNLNGGEPEAQTATSIPVSPTEVAPDQRDTEMKSSSEEDKTINNHSRPLSVLTNGFGDASEVIDDSEECIRPKDEISSVLDSESILVLMSSRNATRGTICEQSHFSHIKFYRSFDVPLGKFLQDNLFNQSLLCKACGGLPEAHFYYYAHHNKQLTIRVKRLGDKKHLPGKSEGKPWMWSRCGKCKPDKEKATKRVLISTAARGLSFGKFLELSFSSHSSFNRLSSCGHSFQKDFLYFFGLGSIVAMFQYSRVATYTVSVPAETLEFKSSINGDWLQQEIESVRAKGLLLFTEVGNYLKKNESRFWGSNRVLNGSKALDDILSMLKLERLEFEENIYNTCMKNEGSCNSALKLLSLNRLRWEILLEACVWDQRLQLLLSSSSLARSTATDSADKIVEGTREAVDEAVQGQMEEDHSEGTVSTADEIVEGQTGFKDLCTDVEIQIETVIGADELLANSLSQESESTNLSSNSDDHHTDNGSISDNVMEERIIPVIADVEDSSCSTDKDVSLLNSEGPREFVWKPFSEIREECMKDLHKGSRLKFRHLPKFELVHEVSHVIIEEGSRLHIPVSNGDYILSDYDGEISSSVACALALMKDLMPDGDDNTTLKRAYSEPSGWSLSGSYDPDILHSAPSTPLPGSRFPSLDGLMDSMVSYGQLHHEVNLGIEKYPIRGKYSVVVMYANEFHGLRNHCCPSELDYIASLSRCKIWDAKGGKSKSFFAKTLDDRLIIKEIKKTEFDSFMKFAPEYFRHMKESFASRNQTCLAKILGIYQITVRHANSGKETKHDLMVQENLSFGRNITRQYDLKGALHARFTATADGTGDVLLDQNFVNDMNSSPLYIRQKSKRLLQRAVWNDTTFLNLINVMDYSLLVGVDRQRRELVCGIIDYLRQYTWDKQLETWVKTSLVVPKNVLPTIISPKEYKKRFRKFMDTHFLTVPDHWCSQRSSNPCKLCGIKAVDSSLVKSEKREEDLNGI